MKDLRRTDLSRDRHPALHKLVENDEEAVWREECEKSHSERSCLYDSFPTHPPHWEALEESSGRESDHGEPETHQSHHDSAADSGIRATARSEKSFSSGCTPRDKKEGPSAGGQRQGRYARLLGVRGEEEGPLDHEARVASSRRSGYTGNQQPLGEPRGPPSSWAVPSSWAARGNSAAADPALLELASDEAGDSNSLANSPKYSFHGSPGSVCLGLQSNCSLSNGEASVLRSPTIWASPAISPPPATLLGLPASSQVDGALI